MYVPVKSRIQNGFVDLNQWNFREHGQFELNGNWKIWGADAENNGYYPGIAEEIDKKGANISVPFILEKKTKKKYKSLWLYLKIKIPEQNKLVFLIDSTYTPYTLYINDAEITDIDHNTLHDQSVKLPVADEYKILFNIVLTEHMSDEMIISTAIGTTKQVTDAKWWKDFTNTLMLGCLVIMALYNLILWIGRKKEWANLYFSLICLLMFAYQLNISQFLRYFFPTPSLFLFQLEYKIAYLSMALGWFLILLFLSDLFPDESNIHIVDFFKIASIVFSLLTIFTTKEIFSQFRILYFGILGLAGIYSIIITVKAKIKKREGATLINIGILIFILAIINDIIKGILEIHYSVYLSQAGLIILLFFKSITISLRLMKDYQTAQYLSANLQDEVNNQTAILTKKKKELEIMNVRLKDMDHQKTTFFQNITHEFRTPLTLILGPLESILTEGKNDLPAGIVKQMKIIRRNSLQLLNLINQLLDLSRIDAGEMKNNVEAVDIIQLLNYQKDAFSQMAEKKNILFTLETNKEQLIVMVDKNKIERILTNLLSNAFKFTNPGGEILIRFHYPAYLKPEDNEGKKDGEKIEAFKILIKDTGIGIKEEHLPFIFNRFIQVDNSTTRRYEGTGIGLALVKEYVNLFKGTIDVKSQESVGTEFTLLMPRGMENQAMNSVQDTPLALPDDYDREQKEPVLSHIGLDEKLDEKLKKKILIIDNNKDTRENIINILGERYQYYEAQDGEAGLEISKSAGPDIIITDFMMPKMNGNKLIEEVRKDPQLSGIPVLLTTVRSVKNYYNDLFKEEPTDFLARPFSRLELKKRVDNLLKISSQTKEIERLYEQLDEAPYPPLMDNHPLPEEWTEEIPETEHNSRKSTIFLVENNIDLIYFIKTNLISRYNIYFAGNGREALEKLENIPFPDVIISDIMMSEMDGITFYKKLKENAKFRTIPFIFLSAKSTLKDKLKGLSAGALDYIYKPFSIQELRLKLESIIEKHKLTSMLNEKDKFATMGKLFAGIFHEIMNPLGATYAALENLENTLDKQKLDDHEKIQGCFSRIFNNLFRINNLIESFRKLYYRKELEIEEVDIRSIIISLKEIFQHKLKEIDFGYEIKENVIIRTNSEALTHILLNLLSNAIDAIIGKGRIDILVKQNEGRPEIIVRDTGIGIKKENVDKIFLPFYTGKKIGKGQGLGLYIVKDLLTKINWEIIVNSTEGEGTEIVLIENFIENSQNADKIMKNT